MKSISVKYIKHLVGMGFSATFASGKYTFAHKTAREGILLRQEDDEYIIENFAFIHGDQVVGHAASTIIGLGIEYLEGVLGISDVQTSQMLGPHATIETPQTVETSPAPDQPDERSSETSIITENDFALQTSARSTLLMMQRTDPKYIQERKGPKGSKLHYVDVQYMTRALNFAFVFDWSFDVVETRQEGEFLTVLGKLTVNMDGIEINKTQWGSQQLRAGMELGDGLKAATSDALKKCASMFGIAADVYAGEV